MRESVIRPKPGEKILGIAQPTTAPPPAFESRPIDLDDWLRNEGALVFHCFAGDKHTATAWCGAKRTNLHTTLLCRGWTLCPKCREQMLFGGKAFPLSPLKASILDNLARRRPWHEQILTRTNAFDAVEALDELVSAKLVKRGAVWLTGAGKRRLASSNNQRKAGIT